MATSNYPKSPPHKQVDTGTLATRIYIRFARELYQLQIQKYLTPAQQKAKHRLEVINKILSRY
jgi:hypothetical protein